MMISNDIIIGAILPFCDIISKGKIRELNKLLYMCVKFDVAFVLFSHSQDHGTKIIKLCDISDINNTIKFYTANSGEQLLEIYKSEEDETCKELLDAFGYVIPGFLMPQLMLQVMVNSVPVRNTPKVIKID